MGETGYFIIFWFLIVPAVISIIIAAIMFMFACFLGLLKLVQDTYQSIKKVRN